MYLSFEDVDNFKWSIQSRRNEDLTPKVGNNIDLKAYKLGTFFQKVSYETCNQSATWSLDKISNN